MRDLKIHMDIVQQEQKEKAVLQAINYLKYNPDYLEELAEVPPFNHPRLKDVDWTKVKGASIEDRMLKLEF